MRKLIRLALVASVLYGTGAHWAILQTAAWATMSMSGQISPCRVCKVVERGSTAKRAPALLRSGSVDLAAICIVPRATAVLSVSTPAVLPLIAVSLVSARPSVPPPKTLLPA